MTDEERERELRDAVERLGYPWSAEEADRVTACRKRCEHPDCKLARAILAALDVDKVKWKMGFESIGSDPLGHGDVALAYRNAIIHAMHAAIFGEKAK